jgi:hypothetical protein
MAQLLTLSYSHTLGPDSGLVYLGSRILLRLTTILATTPQSFADPVQMILDVLRTYESALDVNSLSVDDSTALHLNHPHTSRELLHPIKGTTSHHWSSSVRALWRVAITMQSVRPGIWEGLNSRMLLLASMSVDGTQDVEWARHQAVGALVALRVE